MAVPAMRFSLVASSMKPAGAMIGTLRALASSGNDPEHAAEMVGVAVAENDRRNRLVAEMFARKAIAASDVSREVSVSMTIQPLFPSTSVMLARSKPRNCQMRSVTLNRPTWLLSTDWRQRLIDGLWRIALTKAKASKSQMTLPSGSLICPVGAR